MSRSAGWRAITRCIGAAMPAVAAIALQSATASAGALPPWSVLTFHYDTYRTGWNRQETSLTPSNVASEQFGLLRQVRLDGQVDAQPLFVPGVAIDGQTRNVVYIETDNNTVYAIDAATDETLLQKNLGPPVPIGQLPGDCNNNANVVGILSTPVIDAKRSTMYVMAFTDVNGTAPNWILHALDLSTLADKLAPVTVAASTTLSDGSSYSFDAGVSRQRAALLEANGNIYAGFGSFCDLDAQLMRGLVLGWQAATLTPLSASRLTDRRAHSAENFFLTSVWMSGDGIAADGKGNLYFVSGNSAPTSYGPRLNPSESAIKLSSDLTTVESFFTPSDAEYGVQVLDQIDADFGAGGIMLLPAQAGMSTPLAVAAGKAGQMYLLDRDHLGGYSRDGVNRVLGAYAIGPCWCGESYFTGSDGIGRVVSSGGVVIGGPPIGSGGGGGRIIVWRVENSPPRLAVESRSQPMPRSQQDGGFFTSVSSNGTQDPIVWAVGRPFSQTDDAVHLYAYDPVAAAQGKSGWLFSRIAGTWPNLGGNANIAPVVANGRVYVASYGELEIFGLGANAPAARQLAARLTHPRPPPRWPLRAGAHEIYGTIEAIGDGTLTLATRAGAPVTIAVRQAVDTQQSVDLAIGLAVRVIGRWGPSHLLQAETIVRTKPAPLGWPPDR
jgi:hypothetical protein